MESLPHELLVSIASLTSSEDAFALAVVSRKLLPIGREMLYRAPIFRATTSPFYPNLPNLVQGDPLTLFLRTVVARPDLAKLVRRLGVQPQHQSIPPDWVAQLPANTTKELQARDYSDAQSISQCAIVALVLERLENLEALSIDMIADDQGWRHEKDEQRYRLGSMPFEDIFGRESKVTQLKDVMARVRVLRKINELRLDGCCFEYWWCSMPSISYLRLGRHCSIQNGQMSAAMSKRVHTIELEVSVMDFERLPSRNSRIAKGFLSRFDALSRLVLNICNNKVYEQSGRKFYNTVYHARFKLRADLGAFVSTHLHGVVETLNELEIVYQEDIPDERVPLMWKIIPATLGFLKELRRLKIPEALLLGKKPADKSRLPFGLEDLTITHVQRRSQNVERLLEIFNAEDTPFRALQNIKLDFIADAWLGHTRNYIRARDELRHKGVQVHEVCGRASVADSRFEGGKWIVGTD